MSHHDDRGMATAEYSIGTLATVLIAAVLYRLGVLSHDNPWLDSFRDIVEQALRWGQLQDLLSRMPRFGLRI